MTTAAIYTRISDDREGRELGVERQRDDCAALAERLGLSVVELYEDNDRGASTRSLKARPEYARLLVDARAGKFDTIIAYTSGRLTRRPREHEDLIELAEHHGIRYQYVASPSFDLNTSAGRRVARILAANDAGEAEDIAERVSREVRQRAERREPHGGPRGYGITADGRGLVEAEAEEIRRWYRHLIAGGTLLGLRTDLERRHVPTVSGAAWRAPVIRKVLLNPRNAGLRILGDGIEHPTAHPSIVDRATWQAACDLLRDPGRGGKPTGARKYLGTGLYVCEQCAPRTVNVSNDRYGRRVYKCLQCWRTWQVEPIDDWLVRQLVPGILAKEDARDRLLPKPKKGVDLAALTTERASVEQNMKTAAAEFVLSQGAIRAALRTGLDAGQKRLDEIDAMLGDAGRADPLAGILLAADPVAAWLAVRDLGQQQTIIRALMTVTLGAPLRGRTRWDPRKFIDIKPRR